MHLNFILVFSISYPFYAIVSQFPIDHNPPFWMQKQWGSRWLHCYWRL